MRENNVLIFKVINKKITITYLFINFWKEKSHLSKK